MARKHRAFGIDPRAAVLEDPKATDRISDGSPRDHVGHEDDIEAGPSGDVDEREGTSGEKGVDQELEPGGFCDLTESRSQVSGDGLMVRDESVEVSIFVDVVKEDIGNRGGGAGLESEVLKDLG